MRMILYALAWGVALGALLWSMVQWAEGEGD